MSGRIEISMDVLSRALSKAKRVYDAQQPNADAHECWAEIEALSHAAGIPLVGVAPVGQSWSSDVWRWHAWLMVVITGHGELGTMERLVAHVIETHVGQEDGADVEIATLAAQASLAERTVRKAIIGLEKAGLLKVVRNAGRPWTFCPVMPGTAVSDLERAKQEIRRELLAGIRGI